MSMRRLTSYLLYLGIILFLVLFALTMFSIRDDWNARVEGGRSLAMYEMVQNVIPNRPTDTPGVTAWLHLELQQYFREQNEFSKSDTGLFVDWQDYQSMPAQFEPLSQLLVRSPLGNIEKLTDLAQPDLAEDTVQHAAMFFRDQVFLQLGEDVFITTRRKMIGQSDFHDFNQASNRFLHASIPILSQLKQQLHADRQWMQPGHRFRPVRLYTLCEDGMLTTLPLAANPSDAEATRALVLSEGRELSKLPKLPNFVSNEFFFIFDFNDPENVQPFFSGLYLDLGGHGLVASLTAPLHTPEGELKGVLGLDLSFDLDWSDFAKHIKPPLIAELVPMPAVASQIGWHPWQALLEQGQRNHPSLQTALMQLARTEKQLRRFHNPSPIYHGHIPNQGAAVTFQVDPQHWLVVLFPQAKSRFPTLSLLFLSVLFLVLLAGFEWNRRLAQKASRQAVREFEEKQNLLDTMRVPLMVVDPNTEEIVYGNRASHALGIHPGKRFKTLLEANPTAKAHYEKMQVADTQDRRAYGLPLQVGDKTEYAIIRSVAVQAPIGMIHANERHRLGILFLIDPEADLSLFTKVLVEKTRHEERNKLASLLDHGVDTLTRVHYHAQKSAADPQFLTWLSGYIHRRIRLTSWVLHHWDTQPPLPPDCLISADHVRNTLARMNLIFGVVAKDPELRLQLHWHNGALASMPGRGPSRPNDDSEKPIVAAHIQWPEGVCFTCPIAGGFGFFLSEILVNAIRHGQPGSRPSLRIKFDHRRRELAFHLTNNTHRQNPDPQKKAYGGSSILQRLAHLFGWHPLRLEEMDDQFIASWRVAASENDPSLESD